MKEAPRNEALMMRQLYQSGLIAPLIPSRDALTLARHKKILDSQNYQQIKERRGNESDRSNHKMQLDELKENLRTGRMPNIRVANAEQANLERMITQLDTRIE
jgi:hypothetical protein